MAPKRQKKSVVKTTKVVEQTVRVAVVEQEGNSETVALENPQTRVVEVSVEEKKSSVESVTVVISPTKEKKGGKGKPKVKDNGREEPVSMDVEQRKERENEERVQGELSSDVVEEQSKERQTERGEVEGEDGGERNNIQLQNRVSPEEITNMETHTPEEREGEVEASTEESKDDPVTDKRKTTDEAKIEKMETQKTGEPKTPKTGSVKPKKGGSPEKKRRKRRKRNSIPRSGDIGMGGVGGYKTYVYRC